MWIILYYLNTNFTTLLLLEMKQKLQKVKTKGDLQVKNKLRRNYCDQGYLSLSEIYIYTHLYIFLSSRFKWL